MGGAPPVGPFNEIAVTNLVLTTSPSTIPQAVSLMEQIDALLLPNDGLKWFNWLYRMVTLEIMSRPPETEWQDPPWLERLDLVFAGYYFQALRTWGTNPEATPHSWAALFESRRRPGISRLQYAVAGMNAHINRDLALALIQTCDELDFPPQRGTRQHADYEHVNDILAVVEPRALQQLAGGLLGEVVEVTGELSEILTMWSIRKARETAWCNAEILWGLRALPKTAERHARVIDGMTGFAGRGLLAPLRI